MPSVRRRRRCPAAKGRPSAMSKAKSAVIPGSSAPRLVLQAIAKTAYRANEITTELAANAADIDLYRVALDLFTKSVKSIFDLLFRDNRMWPTRQHVNHSPFTGAQLYCLPVYPRGFRFVFQLDGADPKN